MENDIDIFTGDRDSEDRTRRYFGDNYSRLQQSSALVIGAGAVGTEVVKNLAMLGVRTIHLVDFDKVSASNLNRCVFFKPEDHGKVYKVDAIRREMAASWPHVDILTYPVSIQEAPEELWKVPVVVLAVDNNEARYYINLRLFSCDDPPFVINGATGRNFLEVQVLLPGHTPCLLCSWSKEYFENLFRSMVKESCDEFFHKTMERFPAISVLSSLTGTIMAGEVAKIIIGLEQWQQERVWQEEHIPFLGKLLHFNISSFEFNISTLRFNPQCVEVFCRRLRADNS